MITILLNGKPQYYTHGYRTSWGRSVSDKEKARKVEKRYKKRLMSTKEGRAKLLAQRRKDKQAEYKRKGIDPLGTNPDEALWRDAVTTANNNIDGKLFNPWTKYWSRDILLSSELDSDSFVPN